MQFMLNPHFKAQNGMMPYLLTLKHKPAEPQCIIVGLNYSQMFTASDKGRYFSRESFWGWRDHGPASWTMSALLGCGRALSAHPQLSAPPAHSV